MTFVAEAFGGWLVGQIADASRKALAGWLLGGDQERALQKAATAAIQATAQQLRPEYTTADDAVGASHLARVIDQVFRPAATTAVSLTDHVTLLEGLQEGVAGRLAVLENADITETGQSSAEVLGVSVPTLAEKLTTRLLQEIVARGARGGPLTFLADQLNHDLTHLQGQRLSARLARLASDLQIALATLDRLEQQPPSTPARMPTPVGRPVQELTDPFALEVHRSIDAPGVSAGLPTLPAYVPRDHDRELGEIVRRAIDGHSVAAVLGPV